jgi:dihydrofolate synthase/folylpolyglutamate synthase
MSRGGKKKAASGVETKPRKRRPFADAPEAEKWLSERVNFERVRLPRPDPDIFKLDRMRALAAALGDPQDATPMVHIAGSKGKGSVCEMLASCLCANGYAAGLFTSPHLVHVRERVRIGGDPIGEDAFARLMSRVRDAAETLPASLGEATFFECVTALAFLHYAEQAVDAAVVEVGLGGRLDSTNIITPVVAGITAIQLEHTAILGDTVEKIAREKAGIIKPGVPCLTVPQQPGVIAVFEEVASGAGAPLRVLGRDIEFTKRFESAHAMGPHTRVCVTSGDLAFEHLPVPFEGEHQAENCGLALAILQQLARSGFACTERGTAMGLAAAARNGRLEQVWDAPRVIVDGAHTGESLRCLINAIGAHIRCDSMVAIFGCAADKDIDAMLEQIGRGADKVIFTRAANNPRAVDPGELARRFEEVHGRMSQVAPTLRDAINTAARAVQRDDLICVTGSFHLAGEAKALFEAKKRELAGTST